MALTTRDRRAMIIFAMVVVVAAVAYFLILKPSKAENSPFSAPTTQGTTPASPAPAPSSQGGQSPRPTPPLEIAFGGNDPFSPKVSASGGGGPSSTPPTTGPSSTTTTSPPATTSSPPPTTSPPPESVSPPPPQSSAPPNGTSATIAGHTVVLIDIFQRNGEDMAQVEVDGTAYTVGIGDTFDDGFELVSISGSCATFTHGSQEFELCENPQK